jgi:hypothetical protein
MILLRFDKTCARPSIRLQLAAAISPGDRPKEASATPKADGSTAAYWDRLLSMPRPLFQSCDKLLPL